MLVAVLVAQGILAAHACVTPAASAVQALLAEPVVEIMPCHQPEQANANACLMHCTQADQVNLDQQHMAAVAIDDVILHVVMPQMQYHVLAPAYIPLALNTGPPLAIRFCSFLI